MFIEGNGMAGHSSYACKKLLPYKRVTTVLFLHIFLSYFSFCCCGYHDGAVSVSFYTLTSKRHLVMFHAGHAPARSSPSAACRRSGDARAARASARPQTPSTLRDIQDAQVETEVGFNGHLPHYLEPVDYYDIISQT
jgi:hypothetical protein